MKDFRVSCHMMQKNERTLLEPWIRHHARIFGLENLYIFDNGSTDNHVIDTLKKYQEMGLNVELKYNNHSDFESKGEIISRSIQEENDKKHYNFSFPMDCDEFIGVNTNSSISIQPDAILSGLSDVFESKGPIQVESFLFNNPYIEYEFLKNEKPQKFFFAEDSCLSLDIGFHFPKSKYTTDISTSRIIYFHFHNRRFNEFIFHALQKIAPRSGGGAYDLIIDFLAMRGAGHHVIEKMTMSEGDYIKEFIYSRNIPFPVSEVLRYSDLEESVGVSIYNILKQNDLHFSQTESVLNFLESKRTSQRHAAEQPSGKYTKPINRDQAIKRIYSNSDCILEYRSQDISTSNTEWIDKSFYVVSCANQHHQVSENIHHFVVNIGTTKEWGYPIDEGRRDSWPDYSLAIWDCRDLPHPSVVLIAGRFRVACFLATMMNIRRPTTVLFDDYTDRPHYHVVEEFFVPVQTVGRMAVFEVRPRALHPSELRKFASYFFNPE